MKPKKLLLFLGLPLLFVGFSVAPRAAQSPPAAERPALVGVKLAPRPWTMMETLLALDLDIAGVDRRTGQAQIVADQRDLDLLTRLRIPFEMLHRDLIAFYQGGFDSGITLDLGYGSMGGYFTYDEMVDKLDEFRTNYPNLISQKVSLGKSHQNRDIWAVKISDNPDIDENEPEAIIDCLTHAREPMGMMAALYFTDWVLENYATDPLARFLIDNREMWIVPVHNPDGYVHNEKTHPLGAGLWRKNRRKNSSWSYGVDLNRNWGYKWGYSNQGSSPDPNSDVYRGPYAMSEPEVKALADFIVARQAVERMSIHCFGGYWLLPWCYDRFITQDDALFRELAREMAPPAYKVGTAWELLYVCNGVSLDWDYGAQGIMTFSPEMGNGFWPATSQIEKIALDNLPGLQYFFLIAGSYMDLAGFSLTDVTGNLNGYPDAGETVEMVVTVKNLGLKDSAGPITLNLATSYPHINILTGSTQAPAVPSRSEGDNSAQPFVFELLPSAVYSEEVALELQIVFDGDSLKKQITFIVGTPRRMIFDPFEGAADWWTVGFTGDNAVAGIWERADPNGTGFGSEPVQPEDDHTPTGSACFVTANSPQGSPPDSHDVDEGKTTFISPRFDLTGGTKARIGFSRWYGYPECLGVLDFFKAFLSNDDGATWVNLETLQNMTFNQWEDVRIDVEDFITPTDKMRVRFVARDAGNDTITEAAVDDFWAECYSTHPVISLFSDLAIGMDACLGLSWKAGAQIGVYTSLGIGPGVHLPGGVWYLSWPWFDLGITTLPANGTESRVFPILNEPALIGATLYFQALAVDKGNGLPMVSNPASGKVQ